MLNSNSLTSPLFFAIFPIHQPGSSPSLCGRNAYKHIIVIHLIIVLIFLPLYSPQPGYLSLKIAQRWSPLVGIACMLIVRSL